MSQAYHVTSLGVTTDLPPVRRAVHDRRFRDPHPAQIQQFLTENSWSILVIPYPGQRPAGKRASVGLSGAAWCVVFQGAARPR